MYHNKFPNIILYTKISRKNIQSVPNIKISQVKSYRKRILQFQPLSHTQSILENKIFLFKFICRFRVVMTNKHFKKCSTVILQKKKILLFYLSVDLFCNFVYWFNHLFIHLYLRIRCRLICYYHSLNTLLTSTVFQNVYKVIHQHKYKMFQWALFEQSPAKPAAGYESFVLFEKGSFRMQFGLLYY